MLIAAGSWAGAVLAGGLAVAGLLLMAAALYLAVLAVAALSARSRGDREAATDLYRTVSVLIPAYNEADLIARCIASLDRQTYPRDRYDIVVIADNCTDETAEIATRAGARVLVRDEPEARGKGRALRWAIDRLLAEESPPAAIAVVDADSVADPSLLTGLVRVFDRGADAVQGEYLVLEESGDRRAVLRSAAFLLFHRVRFVGRSRLGLPCSLVGNGMLFSRGVLEQHPWAAYSKTEDLEYTLQLRLNGIAPAFASEAVVRGPVPTSGSAASAQRARWEGGRLEVGRRYLPRLVREIVVGRRWSLIDAALDLAIPPLGLLTAAAVTGSAVVAAMSSLSLVPAWLVLPWLVGLTAIATYVLVGLYAARAPRSVWQALVWSPAFMAQKVLGTLSVLGSAGRDVWVRTERPSEGV
jgi:cellulose synthase/poly-beta-1,6-N-acetylglucosamine synthase-like glycosyltransferase